jgi:uncharacterized protein YoxC
MNQKDNLKDIEHSILRLEGAMGITTDTNELLHRRIEDIAHRVTESQYLFEQGLRALGGKKI